MNLALRAASIAQSVGEILYIDRFIVHLFYERYLFFEAGCLEQIIIFHRTDSLYNLSIYITRLQLDGISFEWPTFDCLPKCKKVLFMRLICDYPN